MYTQTTLILTILVGLSGCSQSQPGSNLQAQSGSDLTFTVSADNPVIDLGDGTKIPVDGIEDGQSVTLQMIETKNAKGQDVVTIVAPATKQ